MRAGSKWDAYYDQEAYHDAEKAAFIYGLAIKTGDTETADSALQRLIAALNESGFPYDQYSRMLEADAPPTMEAFLDHALAVDKLRYLAAATAARFPDAAQPYRELAAKLNVYPNYAKFVIEDLLAE